MIESLVETITESLEKGEKVQMVGFGKFDVKAVEAKTGISKLQGEDKAWATEAHRKVTFKVGKELKDVVR